MSSHPSTPPLPTDDVAPGLAGDALQRRRLLLKGLGKGSAVVAVVAPVQTLAAINPLPVRLCTVSGVQSNVGSGRTGGTTADCQGYHPSHFATLANWPGYTSSPPRASFMVGGVPRNQDSRFVEVFGSGSSSKLLQVFTSPNQSTSEMIWAAALLSALKKQAAGLGPDASHTPGYFPYTPAEVLALFQSNRKAAAEAFFRDYLETLL